MADEATNQVIQLLSTAHGGGGQSAAVQQEVNEKLNVFSKDPKFNDVLVRLLVTDGQQTGASDHIRTVSGLLLKNNIKNHFTEMVQGGAGGVNVILQNLASHLGDPSDPVRNAASICVAEITIHESGGLKVWKANSIDLMAGLLGLCNAQGPSREGGVRTLQLICNDSTQSEQLIKDLQDEEFNQPVKALFPKMVEFLACDSPSVRLGALSSVVDLLEAATRQKRDALLPAVVLNTGQKLLGSLTQLAQIDETQIQTNVCKSFVHLLYWYPILQPMIADVMNYIIGRTKDPREEVALAACEFWAEIGDKDAAKEDVHKVMKDLLPMLLGCMEYSDDDPAMEEADADCEAVDKRENIHPGMRKGARKKNFSTEEEDEDNTDEAAQWNLRKCAAISVDTFCNVYGDELLGTLLPILTKYLESNDDATWKKRESAVLALGAIAEGCIVGMAQYLPTLVPYLLKLLTEEKRPLVKSITCWTLSRYVDWMVEEKDPGNCHAFLLALLNNMVSRSKKVQEASCSACATLLESASEEVTIPYLVNMLQCFVQCFSMYQEKNLFILYDAIVTLSHGLGDILNDEQYLKILMPPLLTRWTQIPDDDRSLLPLLSCLTSLAAVIGTGFRDCAGEFFKRAIKLIRSYYQQAEAYRQAGGKGVEMPDREFMVCAVDLLSGLTEGLKEEMQNYVKDSELMGLLGHCLQDEGADIRQAAFAFVGDLAINCMPQLQPTLPHIMPLMCNNIQEYPISVCNNVVWATGEIAIQITTQIEPWLDGILQRLIPFLEINAQAAKGFTTHRNVRENVGICLGRLSMVLPDKMAPRLGDIIRPWCFFMRSVRNGDEKWQSFSGICSLIERNPMGGRPHFPFICDAFASWGPQPPQELKDRFKSIMLGYKTQMQGSGDWDEVLKHFPKELLMFLQQYYGL